MEIVQTISHEELKRKMDRGDEFVFVETLPEQAFRCASLPGTVNLDDMGKIPTLLSDKGAEITTYGANFN